MVETIKVLLVPAVASEVRCCPLIIMLDICIAVIVGVNLSGKRSERNLKRFIELPIGTVLLTVPSLF